MEQTTFWERVSAWFRPGGANVENSGHAGRSRIAGGGLTDSADRFDAESEETGLTARGPLTAVRRRNREEALARLEDGFQRVVKLCDSLDVHFTLQEERTAEIADSLKHVAGDMSKLADAVGSQGDTLKAIVGQLESGNSRDERMEELCGHFSRMTEAQRQTLAQVAQQVEGARESDQEIAQSLGTFREAISSLSDSASASTESLKEMRVDAVTSNERLSALMEQQAKRFVWLFIVTLVVAAAGIGSFLFGVLR